MSAGPIFHIIGLAGIPPRDLNPRYLLSCILPDLGPLTMAGTRPLAPSFWTIAIISPVLAQVAAGITLTISPDSDLRQCISSDITVTGSAPPITISIVVQSPDFSTVSASNRQVTSRSVTFPFVPEVPAGSSVTFRISDGIGGIFTNDFVVVDSSNSSCLDGEEGSNDAPPAAASSSSTAVPSPSQASTASPSTSTTPQPVTPASTTSLASTTPPASTTSPASTTPSLSESQGESSTSAPNPSEPQTVTHITHINNTSSKSPSSPTASTSTETSNSALSKGVIAGIAVLCVALVAALLLLVVVQRRKTRRSTTHINSQPVPFAGHEDARTSYVGASSPEIAQRTRPSSPSSLERRGSHSLEDYEKSTVNAVREPTEVFSNAELRLEFSEFNGPGTRRGRTVPHPDPHREKSSVDSDMRLRDSREPTDGRMSDSGRHRVRRIATDGGVRMGGGPLNDDRESGWNDDRMSVSSSSTLPPPYPGSAV
ncbi:hypothetical protein C8Q76DRAFT_698454 [Earliella scabrosa]|nr:hypothetical protein C8Q76DRAFT_698454 [Earliella scabrosa]